MTLEDFARIRRDELMAFFKDRYGYFWRRIVTRQAGLHRRAFEQWPSARPLSLYRQLKRVEEFARKIGFTSPIDDEVAARIQAHKEFKEAARQEVEAAEGQFERNPFPSPAQILEQHERAMENVFRGIVPPLGDSN